MHEIRHRGMIKYTLVPCLRLTFMQIILRRSTTSTSTITITPDKLRPHSEQTKLKEFTKSIENFDQLPGVIEEATIAMGLGVVGVNSRAFSRDVLSVEITGPNRPQLSVSFAVAYKRAY